MSKKSQKALFPKTLFARREHDGEETYLTVEDTAQAHADQEKTIDVAEYQLVRTLVVSTEIKVTIR